MSDLLLVATIGVYGFTEESFFGRLTEAGADLLCDVRRRRGLRGATYAFANSTRLQQGLRDRGIRYLHLKHLAPSERTRDLQKQIDKQQAVVKRERSTLSSAFVQAYTRECLDSLDIDDLVSQFGRDSRVVVFLCVERQPAACHRSLLARRIAEHLNVDLKHITP